MTPPSEIQSSQRCVLLFSGGRDSTLAAVRLHRAGYALALLTITTPHLVDISSVIRRLLELRSVLPPTTRWIHVHANPLESEKGSSDTNCLPCQVSYAREAITIARTVGAGAIAFGYTQYQSSWPEQTPQARAAFTAALASLGIEALFPVEFVDSKEASKQELQDLGLSPTALEQKCLRQQDNIALSEPELLSELSRLMPRLEASVIVAGGSGRTLDDRLLSAIDEAEYVQPLDLIQITRTHLR